MEILIKENSIIAKFAASVLHEKTVAVVIGHTIYLWNTSKTDFLKNKRWVQHELVHISQFEEHGLIRFILMYLAESVRNGYYNNRFEREARNHENTESLPDNYQFI